MCFNGSEHFKGNGVDAFCEGLGLDNGGGYNAYTSLEETIYNIDNVPTTVGQERLDSCLLVLYDWANGLSLDSIEIEKERGVIHEEWRMGRDATERILERQLPMLFPESKYGARMPIGLMDIVDNFNHRQLRDYYEKWYNPENQCVVVVGDVDVAHTENVIKEIFSRITPSEFAGRVIEETVPDHNGILCSIDKDEELQDNYVQVLFKHKAYTKDERKTFDYWIETYKTSAALAMLNTRYEDAALKENCTFLSAEASDGDYIYASTKGAFELSATTKDGLQEKALSEMLTICRQAVKYGFTGSEYDRFVKESLSSLDNLLMTADKQKNVGLARECYNNYLYGTDMSSIEDYVAIRKEIVNNMSLDEINQRMKELFLDGNDNNIVIINWNVEHEGACYPTEATLFEAFNEGRNAQVVPFNDDVKDARILKKQPIKGHITKEEYFEDLDYTKCTLSNGATVLLKHTNIDNSQVLFKAYGEGGWTLYDDEDDPNVNLFNSISFSNNNLSLSHLSKLLAGKRVNLSHSIGQRLFSFTGSANPNDLECLMELIHADFTNQSKDNDEFRNTLEETAISIRNSRTVPESAFSDSIYVVSVGHHPRFKLLTEDDLKLVDYDRELKIFKEQTSNASAYNFIFVGNYDEKSIRLLIEKYIASLPSKKIVKKGNFIKTWLQEDTRCHFVREMETPKTMVQIDWFSEAFANTMETSIKADIACRVLNMVYNKIVREENSAAYDCSADFYIMRGNNTDNQLVFSASCSMQPEKSDSVLSIMKREFINLSNHIEKKMFNNAKDNMLKSLAEMTSTKNGFWVDVIWQKEKYQIDTYTNRENLIRLVEIEDVIDFMKKFISTHHSCEVLMKPN